MAATAALPAESKAPPGLTPESIARVRPMVGSMLTGIPAYGQMTSAEQTKLANDMVKLLAYIDNPSGALGDAKAAMPTVTPFASKPPPDANEQTRLNLSKSPGFAGKDFVA